MAVNLSRIQGIIGCEKLSMQRGEEGRNVILFETLNTMNFSFKGDIFDALKLLFSVSLKMHCANQPDARHCMQIISLRSCRFATFFFSQQTL